LCNWFVADSHAQTCKGTRKYLYNQGSWGAYYQGSKFNYQPGDTLVINNVNGVVTMALDGFHGTASCPLVIINEGAGITNFPAFALINCTYVKVTGSGNPTEFYGFQSKGAFSGIDVRGRSSNIEIERIKFMNCGYAIRAKQDGDCADSLNYPNYHMDHISFHDCYAYGVSQDALYFGNTAPTQGRPINCNGVSLSPIPMRLSNISIYNVIVDSVGRTGIQISGADSGYNEIYNCRVSRTGYELNQTQGGGIIIGGMTSNWNVHHNVVRSTYQSGISGNVIGLGRIEYNDIDSAGTIPMTNFDKETLVNTDTNYHFISAGGTNVALRFICNMKKISGTVAATGYVLGSGDGVNYSLISSVVTFTDAASMEKVISVTAGAWKYWKFVVKQTGNAVAEYKCYIWNDWYPLSIVFGTGNTFPAGLTGTAWVRNNKCGNGDDYNHGNNNGYNIVTGNASGLLTTNNIICGNTKQNGSPATIYNGVKIVYTTDCSGTSSPPVANAGANVSITLPVNTATLSGAGSYVPGGSIVSYQWTKVSGPTAGTIATPNNVQTNLSGLVTGIYVFQLKVTDDKGATATANVQVTVIAAANLLPIVSAGTNQVITLPISLVTLTGTASDPDGSIVSTQWTKISGPSTFLILSVGQLVTVISGLGQGVYVFQLTATDDKGATATSNVQVTVNAAGNQLPTVNAGTTQTITLPTNSATLTGTASDSDGSIASVQWTKTSGPTQFTIASPTQLQTVINGLAQGVYVFQLKVTDNSGASSTSTVQVTVNAAANQLPTVNAGTNQTITLPTNSVTLTGTASDPDGSIASVQWTKTSGPTQFTIASPTQLQTVVSGLAQGVYIFQLKVTDNNGASSTTTVQVTVNAAPNQLPIANAGVNQTITLPANSVSVSGSSSYDPDGTIASYQWTKTSGPTQFTITSPTLSQTSITGLVQGVYVFQLKVTDNSGGSATATVQITVNAAPNQLPVANAGTNQVITLPTNSINLSGLSSYDPDGTIASYQWSKISGPSQYTFSSISQSQIVVSGLVQGVYVFELRVTDNSGATATSTVQVTVNTAPNQTPVANAGVNQTITLPSNSVSVSASSSYDPDGTIVVYEWSKINGPAQFTITNPNSAQTTITDLSQGIYTFRITVTDNQGAKESKDVTITVNASVAPANTAPTANAGNDIILYLPNNQTVLSGTGTDPDGTIISYEWSKISGPSQFNISTATANQTSVDNLVAGTYVFQLKVTDNNNATGVSTVKVIVNSDKSVSAALYPNPSSTTLNVKINATVHSPKTTLKIYDSKLALVYQEDFSRTQTLMTKQVNVQSFKSGFYFMEIIVDSNKKLSLKFIKR